MAKKKENTKQVIKVNAKKALINFLTKFTTPQAKRVINTGKAILFIGTVALAVVTLLSSLTLRVPIKPYVVTSGSMRPTIYEGSVAFVTRGVTNINKGDVITFIRPDDFKQNVTHRVADIEEIDGKPMYKTKGDANNTVDPWEVRPEAVWGKVAFNIPLIGYVVEFAKTRAGVLVIVVLPMLLIALDEVRIIRQEVKKMKKSKSGGGKGSSKKKSAKKVIGKKEVVAFFLLAFVFSPGIGTTEAAFSHKATVAGYQARTGDWLEEETIPQVQEEILGPVKVQADVLPSTETSTPTLSDKPQTLEELIVESGTETPTPVPIFVVSPSNFPSPTPTPTVSPSPAPVGRTGGASVPTLTPTPSPTPTPAPSPTNLPVFSPLPSTPTSPAVSPTIAPSALPETTEESAPESTPGAIENSVDTQAPAEVQLTNV